MQRPVFPKNPHSGRLCESDGCSMSESEKQEIPCDEHVFESMVFFHQAYQFLSYSCPAKFPYVPVPEDRLIDVALQMASVASLRESCDSIDLSICDLRDSIFRELHDIKFAILLEANMEVEKDNGDN